MSARIGSSAVMSESGKQSAEFQDNASAFPNGVDVPAAGLLSADEKSPAIPVTVAPTSPRGAGKINGVKADDVLVDDASACGETLVGTVTVEPDEPDVRRLIKSRVKIGKLTPVMWQKDHNDLIDDFINQSHRRILSIYIDDVNGLMVEHSIPCTPVADMSYFVKREDVEIITKESFLSDVQFGTVTGRHVDSLLRVMHGVFLPTFYRTTSWPDSIKNEFTSQMHKFMASLTDARWKLEGKTVLYIPHEGTVAQLDVKINKELIQRLETTMIHWTRQIKEVLSSQDALQMSENAGPLEEIEFWRNRCADLSGISLQLDKPGVKKITALLEQAKSSYVAPFLKLAGQIKAGSHQAQSNLKYLSVLKRPCQELAEARPKDIGPMLPKIINLVRMIWVNSEFYNTRERLTGILRKLSNEIIQRCSAEINLDKIFAGYVSSSMKTLNECIACCEHWKDCYNRAAKIHHKYSTVMWVLDQSTIFAQIDAFIQRCRDLIEVCDCQMYFARKVEGDTTDMPHFGGQRGPEILRALSEIERMFEKNLKVLFGVKQNILDVKSTFWHDDYNRFRTGMKDLEVMMQNLIMSAFDTVVTVEQGIEVLDIFMHLSSREAIKRMIDKKTVDVYAMFSDELNVVKREMTQKLIILSSDHPKFAGQARWAKALKTSIERSMMALDHATFLPQIGTGEETRAQYQQLCQALDEYMHKTFYEWTSVVNRDPIKFLENPLLRRSTEKMNMIDTNFEGALLKIFREIHYWDRLVFEIPHYVIDMYARNEDLRLMRESVMLVVRDYNRVIATLTPEERGLFKERIRNLDKKIVPGLVKLTWASRGMSEFFVTECRLHASKVQSQVDNYKSSNVDISRTCRQISELPLVHIDPRKVYANLEFEEDQSAHRTNVQAKLMQLHSDLISTMNLTYDNFKSDGPEVQQHWHRYTEKMDRQVEEAFRLNIKWSLQELLRAINTDGKSGPNLLFKVNVILDKDKVEFSPTKLQMATMVGSIAGFLTNAIVDVRRLPDVLTRKKSSKDPIFEVIANDPDIEKIQRQITAGMASNGTNLTNYLNTWDTYKEIWEINKDAFIRRYQKLNPQVSSFDGDIARYAEVANNVQSLDTILTIQFVLLDCSPLKFAILGHCQEWQNKFTNLLYEIATTRLRTLTDMLVQNSAQLAIPPQTLDALGESLKLWEKLNSEQSSVEAQFQPLLDQFGILTKYEVPISENVQRELDELNDHWLFFQQSLQEADVILKKCKEKFKANLLAQSEDFKKQVITIFEEFHTRGPFGSHIQTSVALATVGGFKDQVALLKEQEAVLRKGLTIFKIDQPPSKDITKLEADSSPASTSRSLGHTTRSEDSVTVPPAPSTTTGLPVPPPSAFLNQSSSSANLQESFNRAMTGRGAGVPTPAAPAISQPIRSSAARSMSAALRFRVGTSGTVHSEYPLAQPPGTHLPITAEEPEPPPLSNEHLNLHPPPSTTAAPANLHAASQSSVSHSQPQNTASHMQGSQAAVRVTSADRREAAARAESAHMSRASLELAAEIARFIEYLETELDTGLPTRELFYELEELQVTWELTAEWEKNWNGWKTCRFLDLKCREMEELSTSMYKKLFKMSKDLKDKNWDVLEVTKNRVDQLRRTMPLIADCNNSALRQRHWDQIQAEMGRTFDYKSNEFTLEKIIEWGFDQYTEKINEISGAATKELAIELGLADIANMWEAMEFDLVPYKDKGHFKMRSTEEVFQALEDNQVKLSTMKTSRFVKAFEQDVDRWERSLSVVMETIEMLMTVQRQWMYLENIFLGEDIRRQLPKESAQFDEVNSDWKTIMTRLHKIKNTYRGTHTDGLLDKLGAMNSNLEDIQKSLDMYLETKRQIFPRFYFISNDDLLEILGQSKNPLEVQTHFKKCFDAIKTLTMAKAGMTQKFEASAMNSLDGESIPFVCPTVLEGPVEAWLCEIEKNMIMTLKEELKKCKTNLRKNLNKRDKWVKDHPGQMCITASQMQWTADVTKALNVCKERGDKKALKIQKKKQQTMLNKFSDAIRTNLTKQQRLKIVALVTIEVHARDIVERLAKSAVSDALSFDWLKELRFYWDRDIDDCVVKQTNTLFQYGYEYLGNSGRLVITPLTDRCYITLTTALHLHKGGSPKGPAGTGKTETVKDLGRALGCYVIVVNCSEGLDYKSMGRMFAGLAQTGAWGCFDEFNRINIEVLSVVAQQILSIMSALSTGANRFVFEGREIKLEWSCGIFITMNPGYAGRTELPDNLKSMFRPISMIVPDSMLIAEITLFGEGFGNTKMLAKKVFTLYSLAVQQLSKQDHYDFGLRALVSVLRYAGRKKRTNPNMPDEELLLLSMKDMNVAKLTSVDLPLFLGIVSDLFPGIESPTIDYTKMKDALEAELKLMGLQMKSHTVTKTIQLYETKNSRHSTMIVGQTMSGKTVSWKALQNVMGRLNKEGEPGFQIVREFPLNPKALSLGEIYGEFDMNTNEWSDGVMSSIMRYTCSDEKLDEKWIIFDGPVDTLWIESMNSVMDDNKILTLINGERISMPEQVSLLFEVEDLAVASPATVSRCGMVYYDYVTLGWMPYVQSWLDKKTNKTMVDELKRLFEKYIANLQRFKQTADCKELIPVSELNSVISLCKLFDVLAVPDNGVDVADVDSLPRIVELWFQFSMIWSVCASVDEDGRKKIDAYIREIDNSIPTKDTIYEYFVDPKSRGWLHWEEKLKQGWKYNPALPFYKLIVPTVDTVRYTYLTTSLVSAYQPVMLVGPIGTGKTSVAQGVLSKLDPRVYNILTINMSAQTSSNNVQDIIESRVEKRTKGVYVPVGGRKMCTFMDDFNMPAKDTFGSQPPLELIKMWIDYGFWYDRQKQVVKYIRDMFLLTAMGPPGGGRTNISRRLQSRFNLINMTFPQESQIKRIFGSMISQKLQDFEEEIKPIGDVMTQATIDMYRSVVARFLPTPTKIHYLFNLRDISKVFQGLMRASKTYHDTKVVMTRLWIHECFRVFHDRLVDDKDTDAFVAILSDKLGSMFDQSYHNICPNKIPPIFGDYMSTDGVYEDIRDMNLLKKTMINMLSEYNNTPGVVAMDLVLFRDAIEHVSKIVRVIRQPRGNMLLIGIGGSGRQSLTKLSSMICGYDLFQVEVSKHYRRQEFREDLRRLYFAAGVLNKETVFLFLDVQVQEESFLEDINNILSSGEVSNLYKPDEFEEVKNALLEKAKKEGIEETTQGIYNYLIERVRANLHVVLGMSPVGETFRNRIRMYPALVNCTTIDWFSEWPHDALLEVADRYLEQIQMDTEEETKLKPALATMFATMHSSVAVCSKRMLVEMRRHNYVTPTNFLELVEGYKQLLYDKRAELSGAINKLKNGLSKIEETRVKVQSMSKELEEAKVKVLQFQHECDEFLVTLVQQKREADEQQKSVAQKSAKIAEEEVKCQHMADLAQADLAEAMPALEEAMKALESLNKKDLTEIRSFVKPPGLVEKVLEAVMILRGNEPSWAEAKRQLGDQNFIKQLVNFDKDNISDRVLKKIGTFVVQSDFQPEIVGRVSLAAKSLCLWVRAMEMYGRIFRVVEPKRQRMYGAMGQLKEKQTQLQEAKDKLTEVERKMVELKTLYDEKLNMKEDLRKKAEHTEKMLDRASQLVSGLAAERERWLQTVADLKDAMGLLVGDVLLTAAFISYMGPFLSNYREDIVYKLWLPEVTKLGIPCDPEFDLCKFMVAPTKVRDWNLQGLPGDEFSTENGVIVTRGRRWPLMIDPQGQAHKWIKNMEGSKGLTLIDLQMSDYMKHLELAIQFGKPVLLQNVQDKLDAALDPVLNKSVKKIGGAPMIRLGDKEIEYNYDFRFYITTKLGNPHYSPEVATKTTIVNFAVKEQGLMAQLLGIVVRRERPELEEQKDSLVRNIADGKKKLQALEDMILKLLNEAKGSLLDDEELLITLQTSKTTSQDIKEQLETSEETEQEIDTARRGYFPSAERASILFFVLNDMGAIDPMYQFALDSYIDVFNLSIEKSQRSSKLAERISNLNDFHTYAVYRYACRGLFERHKLLFSFHMCAKILEAAGKLHIEEYSFFLRGGIVLDRDHQIDNPCSFLSEQAWDNITELDKLTNFHGIVTSFEQYMRDWNMWYTSAEPESTALPGEWDNACNELQRMLLVRSLRPDRVAFCVTSFIISNLGSKFIEPPVLDLKQVVEDSNTKTPLIFVLSPGVDPSLDLLQIAESRGLMESRFQALSLGQGQAPFATRMIKEGVREGNWVFLANCHLSLSWMPQLDKLIEQFQTDDPPPHPDFRLWLSSSPHPDFPIAILQAGIKMTTEPPKGLKANTKRLYQRISDQQFTKCKRPEKYKKLLFSLCFFHSVLIERRKFLMLGWNVSYDFNDSDFEVSENLLSIYLEDYDETPWEALKFLIALINYGGHVTDDWDRRLLTTYIADYFCEEAITTTFFKLSILPTYYIPKDGTLNSYKEFISLLPNMDHPEAFGQHPNADITSQIQETRRLFETLLSVQPAVSTGAGESREEKVLELADNIKKQIPENIDYDNTVRIMAADNSPLKIVLLQEIERYNALLNQIRSQLTDLERGIQGLVVMSSDLEEIFTCIYDARVPSSWEKAYPSMKPLASWTRDLAQRVEQFQKWATTARTPTVFWLSAFTFPTGFLTAVLQTSARLSAISIDLLTWEFTVMTVDESNVTGAPKDGVLVRGLYLQGAGWDLKNASLIEAEPMQLVCPMPIIHFKPVEARRRTQRGLYQCPMFYYPLRGHPKSFVMALELKTGSKPVEHWIRRAVGALLSLYT